jgi:hypothetical protein
MGFAAQPVPAIVHVHDNREWVQWAQWAQH